MRLRIFLAVGLLALVTGCGGEPKAPPKGADNAPPKLDMDIGTVDGEADKKDKKEEASPAGEAKPDAPPSDSK